MEYLVPKPLPLNKVEYLFLQNFINLKYTWIPKGMFLHDKMTIHFNGLEETKIQMQNTTAYLR